MTSVRTHPDIDISLDYLQKAMKTIETLPKGAWVLISPTGLLWQSEDPMDIYRVLAQEHPLFKGSI